MAIPSTPETPTPTSRPPFQQVDPLNLIGSLPRRTPMLAQAQRIQKATHIPAYGHATYSELYEQVLAQNAEIELLRSQRNHAEAHSILALQETQQLKVQLNHKASTKRRKNVKVTGELLTGAEARARRAAEDEIKAAKDAKKREAQARREARQQEALDRQRAQENDPTFVYHKNLKAQNRNELISILSSLGLPSGDIKLKADLIARIETYFHAHPEEKEMDRYRALFNTRQTRQRPT